MTDNPTTTASGNDPFTALTDTDRPVDPSAEFAATLNNRLRALAANRPTDHSFDFDQEHSMTDTAGPSPTDYLADLDGVSNLFYFSLPAPDLDRAKAFYGTVLGWRVEGGSLGGHVVNVTPPGGLDPTATSTDTHAVYLTVFDLDPALARIRELGGSVEHIVEYDTGRMARCRDDQGTAFCLQEPSDEYLHHARNPAKGSGHGDLYYFSLPVEDGEAGRRFYHELLGWDFGPPGSAGGMHAANMITDGGIGAGRHGDHAEFWFLVDDLATAIETVRAAGGTAGDPMETPQGAVSQCTDNQGVDFGLIQPVATATTEADD